MIKAVSLLGFILAAVAIRPGRQLVYTSTNYKDGKGAENTHQTDALGKPLLKVNIIIEPRVYSEKELSNEHESKLGVRTATLSFGQPVQNMTLGTYFETKMVPNTDETIPVVGMIILFSSQHGYHNAEGVNLDFSEVVALNDLSHMAVPFDNIFFDQAAFYFARKGVYEVNLKGPNTLTVEKTDLMATLTVGRNKVIMNAVLEKTDWVYSFFWVNGFKETKFVKAKVGGAELAKFILDTTSQVVPESDLQYMAKKVSEGFDSQRPQTKGEWQYKNSRVYFKGSSDKYPVLSPYQTKPTDGKKALISV